MSTSVNEYEIARRSRLLFETVFSVLVIAVTAVVATFGAHRLVSAYVFVCFFLVFMDVARRGSRKIGESPSIVVSGEWMHAVPFCWLIILVIVWIAVSELLVGTGALQNPFGSTIANGVTATLTAGAIAVTGLTNQNVADGAAFLVWMSMLTPTEFASPRTAPAIVTIVRVFVLLTMYFVLEKRTDGRIAPANWAGLKSRGGMGIIASTTNVSSRKLAQTGWILQANSIIYVGFLSLGLVILNETMNRRRQPDRNEAAHEEEVRSEIYQGKV